MLARLSAALAILAPALPKPGISQITSSDDAWIDVIQNGRYVRSAGSTGRSDCPGVRLDLNASPVVLQVSGVALDTVAITLGPCNNAADGVSQCHPSALARRARSKAL